MNTFRSIRWAVAIGLLSVMALPARAQFSAGLQLSSGYPSLSGNSALLGGGLNVRIFPTERFAFGLAVRAYQDTYKDQQGNVQVNRNGALVPITVTLDYFLTTGLLRPYLGVDAGLYQGYYNLEANNQSARLRTSNAGFAPRLGLMLALGNLGVFAEGTYHVILGNRSGTQTGNIGNIEWRAASQFPGLNLGAVIGLGGR